MMEHASLSSCSDSIFVSVLIQVLLHKYPSKQQYSNSENLLELHRTLKLYLAHL